MKMSTDVRGNCSTNTTLANASEITLLISTDLRSGPGRFRSVTENGAMLYRHCTRAFAGSCRCRGWASRGPYTAARTLLFPHSMYADPSAFFSTPASMRIGLSSSYRRPSSRTPLSSINFSSFGICSTSPIVINLRGRRRRPPVRPLQVLPHRIREAGQVAPVLDEADRIRGVSDPVGVAVEPDHPVLPDEHPHLREVPDQANHAPLAADQSRHFRGRDLDDLPAREPAELAVRHGKLDPHRLVHGDDLREEYIPDMEVPLRVPELHHPRRLLCVQGGGVRRVDVHEPVGGTEVHDLADDDVLGPRDVPPAQGGDADEPVPLGHDAQAGRVDPASLVERPRTRLQSVSIQEVAGDYNLSTRGRAPLHGVLISRMRAVESGRGLKPLPRQDSGQRREPRLLWQKSLLTSSQRPESEAESFGCRTGGTSQQWRPTRSASPNDLDSSGPSRGVTLRKGPPSVLETPHLPSGISTSSVAQAHSRGRPRTTAVASGVAESRGILPPQSDPHPSAPGTLRGTS